MASNQGDWNLRRQLGEAVEECERLRKQLAEFMTARSGTARLDLTLAHLQLIHQGLAVIGAESRVDLKLIEVWRALLNDVAVAAEIVAKRALAAQEDDALEVPYE
jgi:hypothetical protein